MTKDGFKFGHNSIFSVAAVIISESLNKQSIHHEVEIFIYRFENKFFHIKKAR
jgi:hypothetical protein